LDAAYELELVLPAAFAMPESEFKTPITNSAFSAERSVAVGARTLSARITLHLAADRVPPGEMQAYLDDVQKLNDMLNGGLRVFKRHMNVAAVASPSVEAKLNAALAVISRGLADAELTGADTSAALCERAMVHAYLGHPGDALKDANQAVQRQPEAADMLRCRADVLLLAGKFKEGEHDYARAIARGSDESATFVGKGMAALYQDKAAVARAEFARAMAKAGEGEERQRAAIWHAIAQAQEQGGAMPGSASEGGAGGLLWLAAAQELFAGRGTPEHMLSAAGRGASGRLLEVRLTEAYFYAGKYYALKHDSLRARVYFQNALDKKVLNSTYYGATHHELARLAKP
jgi:lipoprotein NlpI